MQRKVQFTDKREIKQSMLNRNLWLWKETIGKVNVKSSFVWYFALCSVHLCRSDSKISTDYDADLGSLCKVIPKWKEVLATIILLCITCGPVPCLWSLQKPVWHVVVSAIDRDTWNYLVERELRNEDNPFQACSPLTILSYNNVFLCIDPGSGGWCCRDP